MEQLREQGYSYQILRNNQDELSLLEDFDGTFPLTYDKENVRFLEKKQEVSSLFEEKFQHFLQDLDVLVKKYIIYE
ncbi:MAG: hypothetical protein LBH46_01545 [Rickettsiales bacterium]|nr:hypothetical protein [Rickettsiales bacterium]